MFLLNGNTLPLDTPFTVDGTHYPANWLRLTSIEEKNAIGITEVPDVSVTYDDRFYWGVDNPKQLDELTVTPEEGEPYTQYGLKHLWISMVKDTANKLLASSDWMVIRKAERNVDVPAATTTYRTAVIAECTRLVAAITACTDVPALITVVTTQGWPVNE
jgi:hypothetical protein